MVIENPLCKVCGTRHRGMNHDFRKKPKPKSAKKVVRK